MVITWFFWFVFYFYSFDYNLSQANWNAIFLRIFCHNTFTFRCSLFIPPLIINPFSFCLIVITVILSTSSLCSATRQECDVECKFFIIYMIPPTTHYSSSLSFLLLHYIDSIYFTFNHPNFLVYFLLLFFYHRSLFPSTTQLQWN